MKSATFIISFIALAFSSLKIHAQVHYPVISMELHSADIANNLSNSIPDISDSTIFNVSMKVLVSDTTSISNLHVLLKRSANEQSSLLSKNFTYDAFGTFSDGTSYARNGYEIILNLGNFQGTIYPYAELVVTSSSTTTDPIIYY